MSLAKMDSAPSSSVVGLHGLNTSGLGIHHHLIANSEASLLRISNTSSNTGNTQKWTYSGYKAPKLHFTTENFVSRQ